MLYELLLRQTFSGQQVINRFHYQMSGTPAAVSGSFALTSAFGLIPDAGVYDDTRPFYHFKGAQSSSVNHVESQCVALYDDFDFYTRPFVPPLAGALTGEALPPFVAWGLQTNRVTLAVRRGSKRIAGVTEDQTGGAGQVAAGMLAALSILANLLSATLTYDDEGNTLSFVPVVLSYERFVDAEGKVTYKPYATLSEQVAHAAIGVTWSAMPQVRSQVSRQYGRGA